MTPLVINGLSNMASPSFENSPFNHLTHFMAHSIVTTGYTTY